MRELMKKWIAAALVAAATGYAPAARGTDDFYQARLQEGRIALQTGSVAEAADLLRIGCFGLMDQPLLHSEGLVWLTIAQDRLNRAADADATLRRFLDVEKRFAVYDRLPLTAETKKEFEAILVRRLPPEAFRLPALARFVETEEQKLEKLSPKERRKAYEAKAAAEPANAAWPALVARLALEQGQAKDAAQWAGRALEIDAANVDARRTRAAALFARRDFAGALADLDALPPAALEASPALRADRFVCLAAEKQWEPAREAVKGLPEDQLARADVAAAARKVPAPPAPVAGPPEETPVVATAAAPAPAAGAPAAAAGAPAPRSEGRDQLKARLEAACMASDWPAVVAHARAMEPFRDGEEPSMFYAAVGLYETGKKDEARALMERARPRISATPFVNYYAERLLK